MKNNLKTLRMKKGITQKELAKLILANQSTICRIEKSVYPLTDDTIVKLAKFFGCSTDELLGLEEIRKARETKL